MAALTTAVRKRLKTNQFAVPGRRAYPVDTANRARNALSRVSQYGSPAEKSQVRAAVKRRYPQIG